MQKSSICQLLEVEKNLIVASCEPRTILVFQDWKCVKRYDDSDQGSQYRNFGYLSPLPGFDIQSFPFVACYGLSNINLINLSNNKMEPLVLFDHAEATSTFGKQGFFFQKNETGAISLHFTV